MSANVRLYTDVHVHGEVVTALRAHGLDVLTAEEDGQGRTADPALLDRATALGRTLVTYDRDFLGEAGRRQSVGIEFAGIIHCPPMHVTIGQLIEQIAFICDAGDAEYMRNRIQRLPMW